MEAEGRAVSVLCSPASLLTLVAVVQKADQQPGQGLKRTLHGCRVLG